MDQINRLTSQIATLNGQVAQMQGLGKDPGSTQDQRDELIRQLSSLVNISVTQSYGLVTRDEPTDAMREVIAATRSLVFEEEP